MIQPMTPRTAQATMRVVSCFRFMVKSESRYLDCYEFLGCFGFGALSFKDGQTDAEGCDQDRHAGDVHPFDAILEGIDVLPQILAHNFELALGFSLFFAEVLKFSLLF